MSIFPPQPLSPLDGRYREQVQELSDYLSEAALNRARVFIEIEWLIFLTDHRLIGTEPLPHEKTRLLRKFSSEFGETERQNLAQYEAQTRHDVKAVEYVVRQKLVDMGLQRYVELIHFGCTSEDINNLAYALNIQSAVRDVWLPKFHTVITDLRERAVLYRADSLLSRTHGQPATPTTMGKELAVFVYRLQRVATHIDQAEYLGKFNGATGTFAAHHIADPLTDWVSVSREFVTSLGLTWNPLTTQIEPHDWQAELYSRIIHAGRILHNLATDVWTYISLGYFRQIPQAGTTGSSTMPHKINPIRFENAEANLELSTALLNTLAETLVTSRLQRDLTDSTSQRNIGVALGHFLLALDNIQRGLAELDIDRKALARDLTNNWEVLAEAIQTIIRAEITAGRSTITDPYALLKNFTRGHAVNRDDLIAFIDTLDIGLDAKARLRQLSPATYNGVANELVDYVTTNTSTTSPPDQSVVH